MDSNEFYVQTLKRLRLSGKASGADSVLVVCGNSNDRNSLGLAGFSDVTITNIETGHDAEALAMADASYDIAVVHSGLHHCRSPHRAMLEMYRVARKMVVVFEARDSFALNVAKRLGLTTDYEVQSVVSEGGKSGGVRNGPVPNFVYRWTEKEVIKAVRSYAPEFVPDVEFFHALRVPVENPLVRSIGFAVATLFPRQGNEFAFAIRKSARLQPWLKVDDSGALICK